MATGCYLTPNYSRSQSEIQGDLHKLKGGRPLFLSMNHSISCTKDFMHPQKENSSGLRSCERRHQATGPSFPNNRMEYHVHWCAKIKDEVEKLAYQLNEEAEWTERPNRRLSKVMYGSTCADMQVDVMGECLSSIKHVVGIRSVFVAKRLHAV
ncbi:uncharacterized protein TNCV_915351 [Trichonephila clavipes]|nr:uncharacterized protein TNCV_915351 [Trichonephila clavipes]